MVVPSRVQVAVLVRCAVQHSVLVGVIWSMLPRDVLAWIAALLHRAPTALSLWRPTAPTHAVGLPMKLQRPVEMAMMRLILRARSTVLVMDAKLRTVIAVSRLRTFLFATWMRAQTAVLTVRQAVTQ